MIHPSINTPLHRLIVVDALRGFALLGIILIHSIENFNVAFPTEIFPEWIQLLDQNIRSVLFFIFLDKSYAILALLFGFSFFIQRNNELQKGNDFTYRFLWRLFILLCIGFLHSIIYQPDILTLYALMGVSLLIVSDWSTKALLILAAFLLIQPFEIGKFIYSMNFPDYELMRASPLDLYPISSKVYLKSSSLWEVAKGNFHTQRLARIFWSFEKGLDQEGGRYFLVPALFILGLVLGRLGRFKDSEETRAFWKKILIISTTLLILIYLISYVIPNVVQNEKLGKLCIFILSNFSSFVGVFFLVSSIMLAFRKNILKPIYASFATVGRMSLTNYLFLGFIGSFLYYGYGLALYQYMNVTCSFLIGLSIFILEFMFSHWWLKTHKQGPIETLWHKATWIGRK